MTDIPNMHAPGAGIILKYYYNINQSPESE